MVSACPAHATGIACGRIGNPGSAIWLRTQALAPILAFVPTVHRRQSWLTAAAFALDSVSFSLATLEAPGASSATVCHRTGVEALRLITDGLADYQVRREGLSGRRLGRPDFDAACDRFTALGAKMKPERDECWRRFVELRGEYDACLSRLTEVLLIPASEGPLPLRRYDTRTGTAVDHVDEKAV